MGAAGRVARAFLQSKLTPLATIAALGLGVIGLAATPREEEPQISVPMIDIMTSLPGAGSLEVENSITRPVEQMMSELDGVKHVYSASSEGFSLVTVRFDVGEDQDRAVLNVHARLLAAIDRGPRGAMQPIVRAYSINDVPVATLTLASDEYSSNELRQIALHLQDEIRTVADVGKTFIAGGSPLQVSVELDGARMLAHGVSAGAVAAALQSAGGRAQGGQVARNNESYLMEVGAPLATSHDVESVVVAIRSAAPVLVRDVATVRETFGEAESYVSHVSRDGMVREAVTIAVSKREGSNATTVTRAVLERVEEARSRVIPSDVQLTVTRDYGETAGEKARELIMHLILATLSVTLLVGLFLGWREAAVVLVAVPVTLALTLFVYYAFGYTLNRITLFALIFSIGILVDDAIVVVENIYRHMSMGGKEAEVAAVEGVDEVGNPTILATLTVIAAILPMAFVSGMMGPYMRPIPVGASVAMLASLAVAFVVTPWLALRLLRGHVGSSGGGHGNALLHTDELVAAAPGRGTGAGFGGFYERAMGVLMRRGAIRAAFYGVTVVLLLASMGLVAVRAVQVKMLPFDNKSEFQLIVDLPESTTLEMGKVLGDELARHLLTVPEVRSAQVYAGTAAPFNFNGLVRHYFMRSGATVLDVQVNLAAKHERRRQSHAIALAVRPALDSIARLYGASLKVAEIPPGPPVLSTLVAEVYGATDEQRNEAAAAVRQVFDRTPGVVDVDWSVEAPQRKYMLQVDRILAARGGADVAHLAELTRMSLAGAEVATLLRPTALESVPVVARLPLADRTSLHSLLATPVTTPGGTAPLSRFVSVSEGEREAVRMRKDMRPVVYVTGDVAGSVESPVYAIMAMNQTLDTTLVGGEIISRYNAVAPTRLDELALKWDGEWQVTIEVFRDLGLAFAIVLLLIYVLVVGWFGSFTIPLVIMAPIPLTLIGILPGHAFSGAFFTATSMIGMIALAGIIVRNSILLVDFIQLAEERGSSLEQAVIEAGKVRFRPIALTAAAVVIGGAVMVLDPIFQGLAVALMSGAVVATLLTMVVVPLLYWELQRRRR